MRLWRTDSSPDCLVVGLGNPGEEYVGTRHNAGLDAVELLASAHSIRLRAGRDRARSGMFNVEHGDSVTCIAAGIPMSYMNECGEPVARLLKKYKADSGDLVVIHDDLDLDLGTVRLKRGGGSGGHRGVESICRRLGTAGFARVRIGIGRPPAGLDPADYVLKRFRKSEREKAGIAIERAADAAVAIAIRGIDAAMNDMN